MKAKEKAPVDDYPHQCWGASIPVSCCCTKKCEWLEKQKKKKKKK